MSDIDQMEKFRQVGMQTLLDVASISHLNWKISFLAKWGIALSSWIEYYKPKRVDLELIAINIRNDSDISIMLSSDKVEQLSV